MKKLIMFLFIITSLAACSPRYIYQQKIMATGKIITKLCFVGDVGTAMPAQQLVANALKEEQCDQIYILGDLIYPRGIHDPQDPRLESHFMKFYRPLLNQDRPKQLHLILGNHDYRGDASAWIEAASIHPRLFFPHYYYLQQDQAVCIVGLDSNAFKLFFYFPRALAQHSWLQQLHQNQLKNCQLKIALTHHPYFIKDGKHQAASGFLKWFLERTVIGKFDLLISGHEHFQSDAGVFRGTRQLITGVGGNPAPGHRPGYIILQIHQQNEEISYSYQLKEL